MTIYLNSRYENSTVDFLSLNQGGDGTPVVFYQFSNIGKLTYSNYRWQAGDRLESVAMKFYRDPEKWWIIAEVNPEIIDIQNVPVGAILRIPSV